MDAPADRHQTLRLRRILVILLVAVASMRLVLTFLYEANWDEYLNLSMVYQYQRGELREVLQTGFVHLFRWLPLVFQNEADQIIAARVVYLGTGLVTSLAIWNITRELTSKNAALFAVLCYWSLSFTLLHGVAFRTDPLATCALMCALWFIICKPPTLPITLIAGALVGLAGFFTIKAVFYMPTLVLVALIRSDTRIRGSALVIVAGIIAGICFLGLTGLHARTFPDIASPATFLGRTTDSTMFTQDFSILARYFKYVLLRDTVFFAVLAVGGLGLFTRLANRTSRLKCLIVLALLTPLLSVLVYRDVYPYFYPFIFAPVIIVAGFTGEYVSQRFDSKWMILIAIGLSVNAATVTVEKLVFPIATQRATLDVIHRTFPSDTAYIDGRSMVSSMNKYGLFMSYWGMTDYRRAGQPVMEGIIRIAQPRFLLANTWHLQLNSFSPERSEENPLGLLEADFRTLQDNYVQFWGPLYVPGKTIRAGDDVMQILLPGSYRLISGGSVSIEGKEVSMGETMFFDADTYAVTSFATATFISDLPVPAERPANRSLFGDF